MVAASGGGDGGNCLPNYRVTDEPERKRRKNTAHKTFTVDNCEAQSLLPGSLNFSSRLTNPSFSLVSSSSSSTNTLPPLAL